MQGETAMPTAVVVCSAFSLPKMTCKLYPLNAGCAWAPPSVGGTRTMERGTRMVHLPSLHAFRTIPIFGFMPTFGDMPLWYILASCLIILYISSYPCVTTLMLGRHGRSVAPETAS